jgi:sigma-E factor negative regulatory protein RseB
MTAPAFAASWLGVRRQLRRCAVGLGALALCIGRADAGTSAASTTAPPTLDGPTIVKRLQDSARLRSYSGTFVVSSSGSMSSARIVHASDGNNQIERVESLDGQMRRVFRYNDAIHILWPALHSASIEPGGSVRGFPSALATDTANALEMYEVQAGSDDRIAGHDAQTVTLRPRDSARFLQRWWLERSSGLLLRADVVNDKGEVLESAAFSELQLGTRVQAQALLAEMNRLDGYRVSRNRVINTDLEREGWTLKTLVAGFRAVQCVQRQASEPPARGASSPLSASAVVQADTSSTTLLQAIYSDGLTHVSIFIEPYRPTVHVPEPILAMGATHALARRNSDWWITVVGDVPPTTLRQFAQALERRKP